MKYRFLEFEIDEGSFAISRKGSPVDVEPRVFELLIHLIRNRERMVPKDELLAQVWRGYAVGGSVVARCVCLARRTLGHSAAIRTVYARGYQWIAPIKCHPQVIVQRVVDNDKIMDP
jgi:DNA-binding winged helix-turn-helix (wHTH) protein